MEDYKQKYLKYKTKYHKTKIQRGGVNDPNNIEINNLVVYPKKSFVQIKISSDVELLRGFVEDSVVLIKRNGDIGGTTIITNKNTIGDKISKNEKITVTMEDGGQVTGMVNGIDPKMLSLIDNDGKIHFIKKWIKAEMSDVRSNKPVFVCQDDGTLQYFVNSITWSPVYNLYLDSNDLDKDNTATLQFNALVNNNTGFSIKADNIVLVAGDIKFEERRHDYTLSAMKMVASEAAPKEEFTVLEKPVSEILTYPIQDAIKIEGEIFSFPILTHKTSVKKLYIINVENNYGKEKIFIEAQHGYTIPELEKEIASGKMTIFTKSEIGTLSFGSIIINRTPKGTPFEIILGKTPRIRASINKEQTGTDVETGLINVKKYHTSKIRISGELVNDTETRQTVLIRDFIGSAELLMAKPMPKKKIGYLEWEIEVGKGTFAIDWTYEIKY